MELCLASGELDLRSLKCWQAAGVDFNLSDYQGQTPLHIVIFIF